MRDPFRLRPDAPLDAGVRSPSLVFLQPRVTKPWNCQPMLDSESPKLEASAGDETAVALYNDVSFSLCPAVCSFCMLCYVPLRLLLPP